MNNNFKQGFKKFAVVSASALFALSLGGGAVNAMHTNVHAMTADQMFNDRYANHGIPQATIESEHRDANNCLKDAEAHPSEAESDLSVLEEQQDINIKPAKSTIENIINKYDTTHADISNANDKNNPKSWTKHDRDTQPSKADTNNDSYVQKKVNHKSASNRKPAKKASARKNHAKRASNNSGLKITKVSHHRHLQKKRNQSKQIKSLRRSMRRLIKRINKIMKLRHKSHRTKRSLGRLDKTYLNEKNRLQRIVRTQLHKANKSRIVKYHNHQHNRKIILPFK